MALTKKEKAFIQQVVTNKTAKNADIVRAAGYEVEKDDTAKVMYHQLIKKEKIQSALAAYTDLAEQTIIKSIKDYGNSDRQWQRSLAVETSKWVHDKVHGKAAQMNVNVNADFTEHATEQNKTYGI